MIRNITIALTCVIGLANSHGDEPADHQGTWNAVSFVRDGKATPDDVVSSITRTVDGDHIVWKRNGKAFAGTSYKLNPEADPKSIDIIPDSGLLQDKTALGIYKIEGDLLVICMSDLGRPRPTKFAAEAGDQQTLMTFRKAAR